MWSKPSPAPPDPSDLHRQPADIDHARDAATAALIEALGEANPLLPARWPTFARIMPHAQALLDHTDNDMCCDLAGRLGRYLREQGDNTTAITLLTRAAQGHQRLNGPDHPDTLTSRNNLASAYNSAGDLTRAIPLYEATLADAERVLGAEHPMTTMIRSNLEVTTTNQTAPE